MSTSWHDTLGERLSDRLHPDGYVAVQSRTELGGQFKFEMHGRHLIVCVTPTRRARICASRDGRATVHESNGEPHLGRIRGNTRGTEDLEIGDAVHSTLVDCGMLNPWHGQIVAGTMLELYLEWESSRGQARNEPMKRLLARYYGSEDPGASKRLRLMAFLHDLEMWRTCRRFRR